MEEDLLSKYEQVQEQLEANSRIVYNTLGELQQLATDTGEAFSMHLQTPQQQHSMVDETTPAPQGVDRANQGKPRNLGFDMSPSNSPIVYTPRPNVSPINARKPRKPRGQGPAALYDKAVLEKLKQ